MQARSCADRSHVQVLQCVTQHILTHQQDDGRRYTYRQPDDVANNDTKFMPSHFGLGGLGLQILHLFQKDQKQRDRCGIIQ